MLGLNQLPLLMALTKIQKADVEVTNGKGMTPLMITADMGNAVLVDVSMAMSVGIIHSGECLE